MGGFIYSLEDPQTVFDIKGSKSEPEGRVIVFKRKEEDNENQVFLLELGDPPRAVDSDDEDEDDTKRARFKAWFGSWWGWGSKKNEVLQEKDLDEAHEKVYRQKKKAKFSHELLAGAAAYEAVKAWEKKKEENGEEVEHSTAKKLIASFAAAEVKL